jgi:hypothetical protein
MAGAVASKLASYFADPGPTLGPPVQNGHKFLPTRSKNVCVQRELCPKLGVDPRLCCILDAWVHLRQYLAFGDERTLKRTRRLLERQASVGAAVDQVTNAPGRPPQSELVLTAMKDHLLTSVRDAFVHYTPVQLPAILDVTTFAASVSAAERAAFLRDMLEASIDSELARGWASSKASADMEMQAYDKDADEAAPSLPSTPISVFIQWFQVGSSPKPPSLDCPPMAASPSPR